MIIKRPRRTRRTKDQSQSKPTNKSENNTLSSQRDIITNEQLLTTLTEIRTQGSDILALLTEDEKEELTQAVNEGDSETVQEIIEEKKEEIKAEQEPTAEDLKKPKPRQQRKPEPENLDEEHWTDAFKL